MAGLENRLAGVGPGKIVRLHSKDFDVAGWVIWHDRNKIRLSHENPLNDNDYRRRIRYGRTSGDRAYALNKFESFEVLNPECRDANEVQGNAPVNDAAGVPGITPLGPLGVPGDAPLNFGAKARRKHRVLNPGDNMDDEEDNPDKSKRKVLDASIGDIVWIKIKRKVKKKSELMEFLENSYTFPEYVHPTLEIAGHVVTYDANYVTLSHENPLSAITGFEAGILNPLYAITGIEAGPFLGAGYRLALSRGDRSYRLDGLQDFRVLRKCEAQAQGEAQTETEHEEEHRRD